MRCLSRTISRVCLRTSEIARTISSSFDVADEDSEVEEESGLLPSPDRIGSGRHTKGFATPNFATPNSSPGSTPRHSGTEEGLKAGDGARGWLELRFRSPCAPIGKAAKNNEPLSWEVDSCKVNFIWIHKPTAKGDEALLQSGKYPFGTHMLGREGIWEQRFQFTFKKPVRANRVWLAIQQPWGRHPTWTERIAITTAFTLMDKLAPYSRHTPLFTKGIREIEEVSVHAWNLHEADQIVISDPDQDTIDICDPDFSKAGMAKANNLQAFREVIDKLEFKPGFTYTFAFYAGSAFTDWIGWQTKGPYESSLSNVGLPPPLYFVVYEAPREKRKDKVIPESSKNYLVKLAFWSSLHPPATQQIADLSSSTPVPDITFLPGCGL